MEAVTRNVKEIGTADRQALEHVLGTPLSEDQRVVIQVLSAEAVNVVTPNGALRKAEPDKAEPDKLPEWCNVYEGLSDEEIDDIERSIVRSPGSRSFP
jgi:hypothetical protein